MPPTPRLPRQPTPGVVVGSLAAGYGAFAATFRGPPQRFWPRMTGTGLLLGGTALLTDAELRAVRPRARDLLTGAAIATTLYAVFQVGDRAARLVLPSGGEDIAAIYRLRRLRPAGELAARLALVIAPAEELYWRGLVQAALTRRLGRVRGAALATGWYGGAHLATGNPTLIGAATVAGAAWSALAAAGVPMAALVASHAIWDIWIFLLEPTEPARAADR